MTTVTIVKDLPTGGTHIIEQSDFETEQEATEYAILTRRCYDNTPAGSGAENIRVVVSR